MIDILAVVGVVTIIGLTVGAVIAGKSSGEAVSVVEEKAKKLEAEANLLKKDITDMKEKAEAVKVAALAMGGREIFDRRAVLAAVAATAIPFAAAADDNDDAIARIAAKNAQTLAATKAAERAKYQKTDEDIEADQQKSKNLIIGIAGVGTLASGAFIIPNLTRLGIKVASGGQDSGYDTYANSKSKGRGKKKPEVKEKSFGEKLFSAAFARDKF
jgi:hypothetical protein